MSKFDYTNNHDECYALVVEQLEVCADLVRSDKPNKARMAIILLDNLADILMLRYCNYKFSEDDFLSSYLKPKFTKEQVEKAKQNIQGKIELLRSNDKKVLTKKDETIIAVCHTFRNSAQHNDEHNPRTTIAISKVFFVAVSNLFARLQHSGHSAYYGGPLPEWARKYSNDTKIVYKEFAQVIANKLQKGISIKLPILKKALVLDLQNRVNGIEQIVYELPSQSSKDLNYMLKMYQYEQTEQFKNIHKDLFEARYRISDKSINYREYGNVMSKVKAEDSVLREAYKPEVTYQTYQKIKLRIKNIETEKDLHSTLRAYERFNAPLEKIEALFIHAVNEWYEYQELLSDIARGK